MQRNTRILTWLAVLTLSCSTLHGRLSGGRYHAPADRFSIGIPQSTEGRFQDTYDGEPGPDMAVGGGQVRFNRQRGGAWSITYLVRTDPFDDPTWLRKYYRALLEERLLDRLEATLLYEEFTSRDGLPAHFFVVRIPGGLEGATVGMMQVDSILGSLGFVRDGCIYVLRADLYDVFTLSRLNDTAAQHIDVARQVLRDLETDLEFP